MKCFLAEFISPFAQLTPAQLEAHEKIKKQIHCVSDVSQAEVIMPIGGDGAMLQAIKHYRELNKPFIGINAGTRGFLMNDIKAQSSVNALLDMNIEYLSLWMLEADIETRGNIERVFGFNDIWVERATGQTLRMKVWFDSKSHSSYIVGHGMLFSTPQGSTGYNLALGGKVIIPGLNVFQVTPIACIVNKAPLGSLVLSDQTEAKVQFEQLSKRPARLFFDGMTFAQDQLQSLTVRRSQETVTLGFFKHADFLSRMSSWQIRQ